MNGEVQVNLKWKFWRDSHESGSLESQYSELWAEFGGSLARLVQSYEALPQAQEDLLQEIRLAIWMALPKFRGDSSLKTFVFRIAHNRSLTHVWHRRQASIVEPLDGVEIKDRWHKFSSMQIRFATF